MNNKSVDGHINPLSCHPKLFMSLFTAIQLCFYTNQDDSDT